MKRMGVVSTDAIEKARNRVARSAYLLDRQEAIIRALEQWGANTQLACALLYTMYRSRLLMIEYLDQLKRADHAACDYEHPSGSLDEWLQLLTLAMNPYQGPNGPH